jgi:mycothiol synthase
MGAGDFGATKVDIMANMVFAKVTTRPYQDEVDFWRVRNLLSATYPITPLGFNWEIRRWDGWHTHRTERQSSSALAQQIQLWETADGVLVSAAHPDGNGELSLQLHPDYRDLEDQMLAWGEEHLSVRADERRMIDVFVFDADHTRQERLTQRGYAALPEGGVVRRAQLGIQRPTDLAEGYTLYANRSDPRDNERTAALLNAAFGRTFHSAAEYAFFTAHCPSYQPYLDLVALAPDGSYAAMVDVSLDIVNRLAVVEPVCTHPAHRRRGLARTLINIGLNRAQALGAVEAVLGTGDDPGVNALYHGVGFTEIRHGVVWRKVW